MTEAKVKFHDGLDVCPKCFKGNLKRLTKNRIKCGDCKEIFADHSSGTVKKRRGDTGYFGSVTATIRRNA